MSSSVDQWLQQASRARGVLACGARLADGSVKARACREDISKPRIEEALKRLGQALNSIQQTQGSCARTRWTFDSGQIICAHSPDGTFAALFVNRDIASPDSIERLLGAFNPQ